MKTFLDVSLELMEAVKLATVAGDRLGEQLHAPGEDINCELRIRTKNYLPSIGIVPNDKEFIYLHSPIVRDDKGEQRIDFSVRYTDHYDTKIEKTPELEVLAEEYARRVNVYARLGEIQDTFLLVQKYRNTISKNLHLLNKAVEYGVPCDLLEMYYLDYNGVKYTWNSGQLEIYLQLEYNHYQLINSLGQWVWTLSRQSKNIYAIYEIDSLMLNFLNDILEEPLPVDLLYKEAYKKRWEKKLEKGRSRPEVLDLSKTDK